MLFVNKLYIITWGGQVDLENVYILVRLADGVISGESVMYQCRRNGVCHPPVRNTQYRV